MSKARNINVDCPAYIAITCKCICFHNIGNMPRRIKMIAVTVCNLICERLQLGFSHLMFSEFSVSFATDSGRPSSRDNSVFALFDAYNYQ